VKIFQTSRNEIVFLFVQEGFLIKKTLNFEINKIILTKLGCEFGNIQAFLFVVLERISITLLFVKNSVKACLVNQLNCATKTSPFCKNVSSNRKSAHFL
jgi:hypothetical protein